MKKVFCRMLAALALLVPTTAALADSATNPAFEKWDNLATSATTTSISSTTILSFSQDSRSGQPTKDFVPATQFLRVDFDKLADGNLSMHFYGWGRADLADQSYTDKNLDGDLVYGYAQYRFDQANGQIRAGRFAFTEGIVNEQVDGLSAHTDLPLGFGLSAFGGFTVHTAHLAGENTDGKGNRLFGGRLNYRYNGLLELGVSGVYESEAPVLNDTSLANEGKFGSHRLVGGDIWLRPVSMVEIMGHTSYNTETEGVAEHSYLINVKPLHALSLTGEYNEHKERNLFFGSILFSSMLEKLNEKSRSVGLTAAYELNKTVEVSGDYKHYSREIGKADRVGANARFTLLDQTVRAGLGYHYLRSGTDFAIIPTATSSGSFHEVRGYVMRDTSTYFAAFDAIGYFFKKDINGKSSAWELIGSAGYHITPALALSGDLSYGQNPQYTNDFKGLMRLTYNMDYAKGGTK